MNVFQVNVKTIFNLQDTAKLHDELTSRVTELRLQWETYNVTAIILHYVFMLKLTKKFYLLKQMREHVSKSKCMTYIIITPKNIIFTILKGVGGEWWLVRPPLPFWCRQVVPATLDSATT